LKEVEKIDNYNMNHIKSDITKAFYDLLNAAKFNHDEAIVIGGSTSEIIGKRLGTSTNISIAKIIIGTIQTIARDNNIYVAVQCCEHINRALVVEKEYASKNHLDIVDVIPVGNAGGGLAAAAMELFENPVVVERVYVQGGMDIGDVFIGMHIKGVGVVVRSKVKNIGYANLSMLRTRPKLIGGERAKYSRVNKD